MRKSVPALLLVSAFFLLSCSSGSTANTVSSNPAGSNSNPTISHDSSLKDFQGLVFADQSVTYDGQKHALTVSNLPEGATVKYSSDGATDSGVYAITATVSKEGYNNATLTATLTIVDATYTSAEIDALHLSFQDLKVNYDAHEHEIGVEGVIPYGTVITYTINGKEGHTATDVGVYAVIATIKIPNHVAFTMTATLTIAAVEKTLYSGVLGNSVLFQNDLDNDVLYSYSTSLKKASSDVLSGLEGTASVRFGIVQSVFGASLVSYSYDASGVLKRSKILDGMNVDKVAVVDATHFYYSVHNLLTNKAANGIYYFDTALIDDTYVGTKVVTGDFARDLAYDGGVLYYINKSRDLYSYANNVSTQYLVDGNLYELIAKNGVLYYNKGSAAAKGLYKLAIATKKETKLTIDNGINLSLVGESLYYVNKDLLTTSLYGEGIYKTSVDGSLSSLKGTLVVDGKDDNLASFQSDGSSLYYYRFNTRHFYKNSLSGSAEVDLMASFVPEEDTTLVGGAFNAIYQGELYYLNMRDYGCLYKYNFSTKQSFKVLSYSVNNFSFHGNYLYFGSYILTNYAEWRLNLTDSTLTKISSDRCESLRFADSAIYYLNVGATKATLHKMDLDGANDAEVSSEGLDPFSLEIAGSKAYAIRDPAIGYKELSSINLTSGTLTKSGAKALGFVSDGAGVLYLNDKADKKIVSYSLANGQVTDVLSLGTTAVSDFAYLQGHLYFQNVTSAKLAMVSNGALVSLADIAASSIVSDGTTLYMTSAATTMTANYPGTVYQAKTSNGSIYSYASDLAKLIAL